MTVDVSEELGAGAFLCHRCSKPAKLQCPKCQELKLAIKDSSFCSQDCFKAAWAEHKGVHKQATKDPWQYCTNKGLGRSAKEPVWNWTGQLRPTPIGPRRSVPDHIPKPEWAATGDAETERESRQQKSVPIWRGAQLEGIRAACRLAREVLDKAHAAVAPGVTTDEIDAVVHKATIDAGAYPSPLNYYNFPKSVCTSVNEVICHGIPDRRPLQDGDIVNVDVSVFYKGYHGDLNETYVVGDGVDEESKKLIKATSESLEKAIAAVKPGVRYRELGNIISQHIHANGFSVVKSYCGHGVGAHFHCAPNIPHYSHNKAVGIVREGQVFTIEPMVNAGAWQDTTWPDGWTAVTRDGTRSAQFEHTLYVTETGCEVLTARLPDSPPLWWQR
ncbi:hypothetical protein WJX73_001071 [Symbiochloris irregularis]|uniref:Methionine aminopeptidase n=1 Tax=Symbiochloris irregularis TaxID=706552 RepID=A0AAW1NLF9_9CHLO